MGWGVKQDESFPQLLEKQLNKKVLNAGISSYGTVREMQLLKRIRTDSVISIFLQYHANDYEENVKFLKSNFHLGIRSKHSYDSLKDAIRNREEYFPFKHLYGISKGIAKRMLKPEGSIPALNEEAQNFLRVLKHADIRPDIRIIVFKLDDTYSLDENYNEDFIQQVDSLLSTDEFKTLNISTLKLGHVIKKDDYFILDDHINPGGHVKIASKILEHIESLSP
jgi:hypothetical protein